MRDVLVDFLTAVRDHAFLQSAVLAGLLASLACGVVGTYVVVRRITAIAGSLAHCVLGGIGAAYYLQVVYGLEWLQPLYGAVVAALLAAVIIGAARTWSAEREDTVISALWAIGMAVGVLFLFQTPGYKADLVTYLFGNIVMVDPASLRILVLVDVAVLGVAVVFYQQLLAICFDEEFAKLRGVRVGLLYTLLLALAALTIVTLVYVVGVVLVIALLTLPVAVANRFVDRLWLVMGLAALLSAALTTVGLGVSYSSDLPAGPTTIVLCGGLYLLTQASLWGYGRAVTKSRGR
jgi:zinc transport system permease protein